MNSWDENTDARVGNSLLLRQSWSCGSRSAHQSLRTARRKSASEASSRVVATTDTPFSKEFVRVSSLRLIWHATNDLPVPDRIRVESPVRQE